MHHKDTIEKLSPGDIAVLGIPFDKNSSYRQGPALAPNRIIEALFSESTHLWTEGGTDLGSTSGWYTLEDLIIIDNEKVFDKIESAIGKILNRKARLISLGGDHSITYPILRGYGRAYPGLSILQLDAHPDLYDELYGNRFSHACPFARIMEEKLAKRLVQVGIRTITDHQREQADRFGVEIIEMREINKVEALTFEGPVYLSLDMDCIDPAFAPGVSHHEPGGMSTRHVLSIIQNLSGDLVGADIVEFNPERDPLGITAMTAGKLLKETIGRMMEEGS
jgi:agmatinase